MCTITVTAPSIELRGAGYRSSVFDIRECSVDSDATMQLFKVSFSFPVPHPTPLTPSSVRCNTLLCFLIFELVLPSSSAHFNRLFTRTHPISMLTLLLPCQRFPLSSPCSTLRPNKMHFICAGRGRGDTLRHVNRRNAQPGFQARP